MRRNVDKAAFGERLAKRRTSLGLTQATLASRVGMRQQGIDEIEHGVVARPRLLREIANALNTTEQWLLWEEGPEQAPPATAFFRMAGHGPFQAAPESSSDADLPVYAAAEGGPGEMVVSTDPIELVPRPWFLRNVRDGYAVLITGESMVPVFEPGDIAIVNPRLPFARGKDVILVSEEAEGDFRASIKRLVSWTVQNWRLHQFNPPSGQKTELILSRKAWPKALRVVGKYYGG